MFREGESERDGRKQGQREGFCVRRGLVQRARGATCAGEPKRTGSTLTCDDIAIVIIMI